MNINNPEDLFENFQPQALHTTLCVDGETLDFKRSVFCFARSVPRWRVIFECIFYSKRASLPFKVYLTHVGQNLFCRRSINREYQCEDRYAATFPRERLFPEQLRLAPEGAEINVYIEDCREWDVADRSFLLLPGEARDYLTPVHIHLYKKEQQDPLRDTSLRSFAGETFSGVAVRCVFDVHQPIKDDRYEIFFTLRDSADRRIHRLKAKVQPMYYSQTERAVVAQALFDREEWPEDDYRLEVSFLGELMTAVRFTVGDGDIPGAYGPADFEK
ncbi:hypothetical protein B5F90_10080 [Alistipes sp. An31A]|uniref:hypothetical protein n=1 Tax=Alistipes sp. An31A TaxID=1965631 RepID=UPI000B39405A|nr:hypothetical protein [Alistipes sp. An31A]OUO18399.1 hypothetical protein B5F90_10080 [Alistipes sp. An31A]